MVGYDYPTKTLYIQFKRSMYAYYDVPVDVYVGLISAPSKGSYHHINIKWRYRYKKL